MMYLLPDNSPCRLKVMEPVGTSTIAHEVCLTTELAWFVPNEPVENAKRQAQFYNQEDLEFWVWLDKTTGIMIRLKHLIEI